LQNITSFLASLGIMAANKVGKSVLKGITPTEWDRQAHSGMIYHLSSSQIPFVKLLVVKEYERGVFLRDGKLYAVLPPGRWFLGRMPIVGHMELIWVDMGITKIQFGLRTLTKDGVEIGANGTVYLRVSDPEKFIINLITGKNVYHPEDLQDFLKAQVNSIMRSEMANYDVQSIYLERDMFISVARVEMQEMIQDLGVEFRSLEIAGLLLSQDVKEALQKPLIASKEAQATVLTGTASAQVLAKIQEVGVDPIKFKAAEALMKYSERPNTAGGSLSGDFLMPLVFFGMLMKDTSIPTDIKTQLKDMFPQFSSKTTTTPSTETKKTQINNTYTKERIQSIIDGLDEQLAKGKISEKTYNELRKKWETKLKK
jgi:hypothetical protein